MQLLGEGHDFSLCVIGIFAGNSVDLKIAVDQPYPKNSEIVTWNAPVGSEEASFAEYAARGGITIGGRYGTDEITPICAVLSVRWGLFRLSHISVPHLEFSFNFGEPDTDVVVDQ
jgi:hypothetical protein